MEISEQTVSTLESLPTEEILLYLETLGVIEFLPINIEDNDSMVTVLENKKPDGTSEHCHGGIVVTYPGTEVYKLIMYPPVGTRVAIVGGDKNGRNNSSTQEDSI